MAPQSYFPDAAFTPVSALSDRKQRRRPSINRPSTASSHKPSEDYLNEPQIYPFGLGRPTKRPTPLTPSPQHLVLRANLRALN